VHDRYFTTSYRYVAGRLGQEVLLAAATASERLPDGSGEYWHVTMTTDHRRVDGHAARGLTRLLVCRYCAKPSWKS
jgi:hypothetical protein